MLAFPIFSIQLWRFVAPGMYAKEKKAFLPFLLLTPVFFAGGAAFAYFVAMPWALHFLLGFEGEVGGVKQHALPGVGNYLNFVTRFLFGFGVAFLAPILLMILERAGLVTRQQLVKGRRYAVVASFGIAAVLTPPDAVSQFMLAVPLYTLYEFAILAIRLTHWRAARRAVSSQANGDEVDTSGRNLGPKSPPGGGRVGGSGPI
jgi:sec-independent protein translocase protein TatC